MKIEREWCLVAKTATASNFFNKGQRVYCLPRVEGEGHNVIGEVLRKGGQLQVVLLIEPQLIDFDVVSVCAPGVVRMLREYGPWQSEGQAIGEVELWVG